VLSFPLGNYTKEEVRGIAQALGLGASNKPESQNFITGGYFQLVAAESKPGPILDRQGNALGQHQGIPFYTVGQRRGLGVSVGERLYVVAIEQERNAIIVGTKKEVYEDKLIASDLNWIAVERLWQPVEVKAKIRYLHKEAEAEITPLDGGKVRLKFKEPQMAIAPGQAVVFYDRDVVMGGGKIERAGR